MTRLPTVPLGEVCSFLNGGTPSKSVHEYFNGDIPWITGADITSSVVTNARSYITEDAVAQSATNFVPAGTVLLVTRTSVGKVATAGVPLCFSQDITALIPDFERVDTNYLVHFLRTKQGYFEANARGATIQGITRQLVANLDFPDCDPREQQRIAAILDKADAIRSKRQQALRLTDDFLRSVFLDMFGDLSLDQTRWPIVTMDQLGGDTFRNGLSPSNTGTVSGRVLTLTAITSGTFRPQYAKDTVFDRPPSAGQIVTTKDFLICRGNGNKNMVGIGVVPTTDLRDTAFPDTMIGFTPDATQVELGYLESIWQSSLIRRQIDAGARTTNGTFKVNQSVLGSVQLPLPPPKLQQCFVAIKQRIALSRSKAIKAHTEAQNLFASLQQRAFTGQL